jgi:hypothetical protein
LYIGSVFYEVCLLEILIHIDHIIGTASQCKHNSHAAGAPAKNIGCTLAPSQRNSAGNNISSIISHTTIMVTNASPCSFRVSKRRVGLKCSSLCLNRCLSQFHTFLNYISCSRNHNGIRPIIGFRFWVTKFGILNFKSLLMF